MALGACETAGLGCAAWTGVFWGDGAAGRCHTKTAHGLVNQDRRGSDLGREGGEVTDHIEQSSERESSGGSEGVLAVFRGVMGVRMLN
jgi:hypothetical protein